MPELKRGALDSHSPSAVGLTRLSTRLSFPPGGEALYRSILRLLDLSEGSEFLIVPCGRGRSALFVAESTGAGGAGADPDPVMAAMATNRAKAAGLVGRLHFEQAPLDELPYQDDVFDVALGEIELGAARDPDAAVREIVRVTKPGGTVVLIQLVWLRAVDDGRRRDLVEHLGVRPRMLVEWKQRLRDAGIEDLHVEDWSDSATSRSRPSVLGGLAELFTLPGKLRLLPRAWRRWGWKGVRALMSRERELRRLLEEERVLGVTLIKGTRRAEPISEGRGEEHDE
ncbi:MAG: methyltransferase domain-containing protein [Longimicrobiales bacterium]|nr:methyltransferase domain-containing protein [Longimicrobiales bacterium]